MGVVDKYHTQQGFTIAELIIVIVVIGILATVSIVGYGSWRTSTAKSEVQSNLNGVVSAMESARGFNNGYPVSIPSTIQQNNNVTLAYVRGDSSSYCITGTSTVRNSVVYYVDSKIGSEPRAGSCPAVITNMVANPSFETNITGWAAYIGVSAPTRVTTTPYSGTARLSAVGNNTSSTPRVYYIVPTTVGDVVSINVRIRSDGQTPNFAFLVIKTRLAGAETSTPVAQSTAWAPDAAGWMQASVMYTVPANTDSIMVLPGVTLSPTLYTGTLGVDAVIVAKNASAVNFADGNSQYWAWDGTANNSTSTGPAL